MLRGLRGATTAKKNSPDEIWTAAKELVTKIVELNEINVENIGAIIFSSTKDLNSAFPSSGVRKFSEFQFVPLFDAQETFVESDLPMCIRVLILADVEKSLKDIRHVYLNNAKKLRPDLADG